MSKHSISPSPGRHDSTSFSLTISESPLQSRSPKRFVGNGSEMSNHRVTPVTVMSKPVPAQTSTKGAMLPYEEYGYWAVAMTKGDVAEIESILNRADPVERQNLITGQFCYTDAQHLYDSSSTWLSTSLLEYWTKAEEKSSAGDDEVVIRGTCPFHLAAMCGHGELMTKLMDYGADPAATAFMGWNVLHCVVTASVELPSIAEVYTVLVDYLRNRPDGEELLRTILTTEDTYGYRPFELSMRVGAFRVARLIFNTEGIYKFTQSTTGTHEICWFDITDYTFKGDRMNRSPLALLMHTSFSRIKTVNARGFLDSPVMNFARIAQLAYIGPALFWFLYRLAMTLVFMVFFQDMLLKLFYEHHVTEMASEDANFTEASSECKEKPFTKMNRQDVVLLVTIFLYTRLFLSTVSHILELHSRFKDRAVYWEIMVRERSEVKVTSSSFFYVCDVILVISAIIVLELLRPYSYENVRPGPQSYELKVITYLSISLACITNVWSLLFFIRLMPVVGYFVIVFQEMVSNMARFLLIYGLIFLSFFLTFYAIIGSQCLDSNFSSLESSSYATFTMMLNMVAVIGNGIDINTPEGVVACILHVAYVGVVAILLLNFLIAIMSNSVTEVAEHREIITELHRLSLGLTVEKRLFWILKKLYRPRNKRLKYHNGRVYMLSCVRVNVRPGTE